MKRIESRRLILISLVILLVSLMAIVTNATYQQAETPAKHKHKNNKANYVVMISIDGMRPDYYTQANKYHLKLPNLRKFMQQGSYAEASESIYPSLTYPAHTTLVTGVKPAKHGIVANQIWQGEAQPFSTQWYWYAEAIKVPTLWSAAHKQGLKTAAISWPVTTGADIDYLIPEVWQGSYDTHLKLSFEKSTPGLPELVLKEWPQPTPSEITDELRAQAAQTIIHNYQPQLLLVHFAELDFAEHFQGPFSTEALAKLEATDALIGKIAEAVEKAGIAAQTTFLVVSDHGFMSIDKQCRPNVALAKAGFITLSKDKQLVDWQAITYGQGGSMAIMLKKPNDKITEFKVIELFEQLANKPNSPINRVVKRPELDVLGANPQAICFLDAAAEHELISDLSGDLVSSSKVYKGTHGALPSRSEMFASFIATGRGIRAGQHSPFTKNINVAPTVAALLGLSLPDAEGRPIREFLDLPTVKDNKSPNKPLNKVVDGEKP